MENIAEFLRDKFKGIVARKGWNEDDVQDVLASILDWEQELALNVSRELSEGLAGLVNEGTLGELIKFRTIK